MQLTSYYSILSRIAIGNLKGKRKENSLLHNDNYNILPRLTLPEISKQK